MSRKRLRVFVSSPGDVTAAREIAAQIIEKVAHEFARFFAIEPYLWEYEPMLASGHFQDSIDPPSKFDAVILILGSRLGTALPERTAVREYRGIDGRAPVTGTEWEFEDALAGARECGVPDLLVYRSRRDAEVSTWDAQSRQTVLKQIEALDSFWSRHFADRGSFIGGYAEFVTLEEFAGKLESGLRGCVQRRLQALSPADEIGGTPRWSGNPFRGLEAYQFEHAPIFFGREGPIGSALLRLVTNAEAGRPFLLVLGASGTGKSSLLKAGVLPRLLIPQRVSGAAFLRRVTFRPGDTQGDEDLFDALARRLTATAGEQAGLPDLLGHSMTTRDLARHLREGSRNPGLPFALVLDRLAESAREKGQMLRHEKGRLILEVDQLEELFTAERVQPNDRRRFVELLAGLVRSELVWVIATMRADFWHRALEIPELVELADRSRLDLLAPTPAELSQMLRGPAEAAAIHFEVDSVSGIPLNDVIAQEAAGEPGALPLLSYLLDQVYQKDIHERCGDTLTYASYNALGRLKGAIATRADAVIAAQPPQVQQALRPVLFALVQIGAGEGGVDRAVARRAPLSDFPEGTPKRQLIDALLNPAARLLVADAEGDHESTVRLAHEALISEWNSARSYVAGSAEALKTRREVEERYARWLELREETNAVVEPSRWARMSARFYGRERGLLADADLADGRRLLRDYRDELSPEIATYIQRSISNDEHVHKRAIRVLSVVVTVISLLAIIAAGAGWLASKKQQEAEYQSAQALRAQEGLLTDAAAEQLKKFDLADARGVIMNVLSSAQFGGGRTPAVISVFQDVRAADALRTVFRGYGEYLNTAVYSPDGGYILTSSYDKTAAIWDLRTGTRVAELAGHQDVVTDAHYSPNGAQILTASRDKTARIWDARTLTTLMVLANHADRVQSAKYSPDGTRIVTASDDHTARVWDARTGAQLALLSGHTAGVEFAAYSPDGSRIVTASDDKTARVWDAHTGRQLALLSGHGDRVYFSVYSPDGSRIATASEDKTARIWDAHTGAQLAMLLGHGSRVNCAVYSPDGTRLVTASYDKTVRIWDAHSGAQLSVLSGHGGIVVSAAYSPDGRSVVTAADDRTVRIWDVGAAAQLPMLAHGDHVSAAAYSPDGSRIVTASHDKVARIWDAHNGAPLTVLSGHADRLYSAVYSPDGRHIATVSYDKTARIWDARTGAQLMVLRGHQARVNSAAYSPDGARLVTASFDKTARIWSADSGAQLAVLAGHSDRVRDASYSPDGTRIATASTDKTARIWDARTAQQLIVLTAHGASFASISFAPDGARVVTGLGDKTARVWDVRTGAELLTLSGHQGPVFFAGYSPDGTRIVTGSSDMTARIWDAHTGAQLAALSGHTDYINSARYSPDGTHIVTASDDGTARVWDAAVQANLDAQIAWAQVAESDPLPNAERTRLGLVPNARIRERWMGASACDQAAGAFYDPNRAAPGVLQPAIVFDVADSACRQDLAKSGNSPRLGYEMGRVLLAKPDVRGAKHQLELAASDGYPAARIDLAGLELDPAADVAPQDAVSLYEQAWKSGVAIAAFELARLYEAGVSRVAPSKWAGIPADPERAWSWYRQGAEASEPNSLARFAERYEQSAIGERTPSRRNGLLLQALSMYARACERAQQEDWPDDAWRKWRFRRSSLARLLAHEGMMEEVAREYEVIRARYAPHPGTWGRVASFVFPNDSRE